MQLARLDHELNRIMKEKERCEQLRQVPSIMSSSFAGDEGMNMKHNLNGDQMSMHGNYQDRACVTTSPRAVIEDRNNSSIWTPTFSNRDSSSTAYLCGGDTTPPTRTSILPPFFHNNR